MSTNDADRVIVEWGNQLLRPSVRRYGRPDRDPKVTPARLDGKAIRAGLLGVIRRHPEVMVKVTGGGRGMKAIKAHMQYISRNGALSMIDEQGQEVLGREEVKDLAWEWQHSGALIPDESHRREAFHVMFSMPPETDAQAVFWAARRVAELEFALHKYAMVLHEPEGDEKSRRPHVHLIVRTDGQDGRRLNPRKVDLARWREHFAERLQERGIAAAATRRQARGVLQPTKNLRDHHIEGIKRKALPINPGEEARKTENAVIAAWGQLARELAKSNDLQDQQLARDAIHFMQAMPTARRRLEQKRDAMRKDVKPLEKDLQRSRDRSRDISR